MKDKKLPDANSDLGLFWEREIASQDRHYYGYRVPAHRYKPGHELGDGLFEYSPDSKCCATDSLGKPSGDLGDDESNTALRRHIYGYDSRRVDLYAHFPASRARPGNAPRPFRDHDDC